MRHNRYSGCGYCGIYSAEQPVRAQCPCGDDSDCACDIDGCDRCEEEAMPICTLAIASVPIQSWTGNAFEEEAGLTNGTIFPELVMPFCGGGCI